MLKKHKTGAWRHKNIPTKLFLALFIELNITKRVNILCIITLFKRCTWIIIVQPKSSYYTSSAQYIDESNHDYLISHPFLFKNIFIISYANLLYYWKRYSKLLLYSSFMLTIFLLYFFMISVVPAKPPLHQEAFENTSISSLYPLPALYYSVKNIYF